MSKKVYNIEGIDIPEMIQLAINAQKSAYVPYSGFQVGAALICKDGSVYTGCNVENASYPAGNCAERTAVFKAVSEGQREFTALAVIGSKPGQAVQECAPCGICRQVIAEFVQGDFPIILAKSETDYRVITMEELLPLQFSCNNLK